MLKAKPGKGKPLGGLLSITLSVTRDVRRLYHKNILRYPRQGERKSLLARLPFSRLTSDVGHFGRRVRCVMPYHL
ncbi:MAG: hypothetical protein U0586_14970 [Candidatus Brocadiaceae bacterium]